MPGIPPQIPGYGANNRVPSVGGQVQTGVGGSTASDLPKKVLVVGLATSAGTITPDKQAAQILSQGDADNYAGPGGEGACMLYDELLVAAANGVPITYVAPTPGGGGSSATSTIKLIGTTTAFCTLIVRVNGQPISIGIPPQQTAAQAATLIAQNVAGLAAGRTPVTASASGAYVTLTYVTPGVRGMEQVVFIDTTGMVAGMTAQLYQVWTISTTWAVGDQVVPTVADGFYFRCTTPGAGSGTQPTWPTTIGATVTDGAAVWTCWGVVANGLSPTTAVFLGNGTGLESYTNLLNFLAGQTFDRIVLAANDATSLAAWKAQIDAYALAPNNNLQQVIVGHNGTFAAAQAIAQTTLNDTRFELLWEASGETHPSRMAATFGGIRASTEQGNPNPNYDGLQLPNVAPQSQLADQPTLAVLISAINNSVTPVTSGPFGLGPGGDGFSRVVRAITTKSLTAGFPDYSCIDVGMQTTADFVWLDAKIYYLTVVQKANPVVSDDVPNNQKPPASGVLTPKSAKSTFGGRLVRFSQGNLSSAPTVGAATIPPIILPPQPGDVQAIFDQSAKRIVLTEIIRVMPLDHQLGIIVQQAA
jgi:phage tail sheath gpL-like